MNELSGNSEQFFLSTGNPFLSKAELNWEKDELDNNCPRKGCSPERVEAVRALAPSRIVMVSCDPATAVHNAKSLGCGPVHATLVDLFPRTKHVEVVMPTERK